MFAQQQQQQLQLVDVASAAPVQTQYTPVGEYLTRMLAGDATAQAQNSAQSVNPFANSQNLEAMPMRHAQQVTLRTELVWRGSANHFSESEANRTFSMDPRARTRLNSKYSVDEHGNPIKMMLMSSRITRERNTTGHDVAITFEDDTTQVNIGTNLEDGRCVAHVICADTRATTLPNGGVSLYVRDMESIPRSNMLAQWDGLDPETVEASVLRIDEENNLWTIAPNSPIVHVADYYYRIGELQLVENDNYGIVTYRANGEDRSALILEAGIARKCKEVVLNVIASFPFEKVGDVAACISRSDNKHFAAASDDDAVDVSAASSYYRPRSDASVGRVVSVTLERTWLVYHVGQAATDAAKQRQAIEAYD